MLARTNHFATFGFPRANKTPRLSGPRRVGPAPVLFFSLPVWQIKREKMRVVAKTDPRAGVSDQMFVQIAKFVAQDGLRGGRDAVARVVKIIRAMSTANKHLRKITLEALRPALAAVMSIALPQTVSTRTYIECMNADPELARSIILLLENENTGSRSEVESAAILSRLVGLSKAAERALDSIVAARKFDALETEEAMDAKAAARAASTLLGLVVRMIDSARPALRASLLTATVGSARMYPDPLVDGVLDAVIGRLKVRPYERIPEGGIRSRVHEFIEHVHIGRPATIDQFGPLCLWDVSEITNFDRSCNSGINFNSDLFWNTKSATSMADMFFGNAAFKGYVGTWNVASVRSMGGMFGRTAIEDSGIASWNTASVTDASNMFSDAMHLSKDLDLSGWIFKTYAGDEAIQVAPLNNLRSMFARSSIVDSKAQCAIL
jgi:hypothetical protein